MIAKIGLQSLYPAQCSGRGGVTGRFGVAAVQHFYNWRLLRDDAVEFRWFTKVGEFRFQTCLLTAKLFQFFLVSGSQLLGLDRGQSRIAKADLVMTVSIAAVGRNESKKACVVGEIKFYGCGILAPDALVSGEFAIDQYTKLRTRLHGHPAIANHGTEAQLADAGGLANGGEVKGDASIGVQAEQAVVGLVIIHAAPFSGVLAGDWSVADHVPRLSAIGGQAGGLEAS